MFSLNEFIKKGLLDAIGKMADYQVILNATGWYEKNVLIMEDLEEINAKIDEKNAQVVEKQSENESNIEENIEEDATGEDNGTNE